VKKHVKRAPGKKVDETVDVVADEVANWVDFNATVSQDTADVFKSVSSKLGITVGELLNNIASKMSKSGEVKAVEQVVKEDINNQPAGISATKTNPPPKRSLNPLKGLKVRKSSVT
jgi:hypothetical protein